MRRSGRAPTRVSSRVSSIDRFRAIDRFRDSIVFAIDRHRASIDIDARWWRPSMRARHCVTTTAMGRRRGGGRRAVVACACACACVALAPAASVPASRAVAVASSSSWASCVDDGARGTTTTTTWASWAPSGGARVARAYDDDDDDDDDDDGALFDAALFADAFAEEEEDEDEDDGARAVETADATRTPPPPPRATSLATGAARARDDDDDDDAVSMRVGETEEDAGADAETAAVLASLVELGGAEARALFDEAASKFGIDFDADDDDDDEDEEEEEEEMYLPPPASSSSSVAKTLVSEREAEAEASGAADVDDVSSELLAVEYREEEDDSEDEAAIEARKKLLLELGVNIDEEPPRPAVVEPEPEPAPKPEPKPTPEVTTLPRERRRSLLGMIDINSAMWLGWNSLPAHLQQRVSVTPPSLDTGDSRVVRVGGYWRAASANNRRRRQSKSRNGFPLRRGQKDEVVQECNQRYNVVSVQCFGENSNHVAVTVKGAHSLYPGDFITFERLGADDSSLISKMNRQHRVYAIPASLGTDQSAINWQEVWKTSPFLDGEHSVFAVTFDVAPGAACDVYPNPGAIVRRSANARLPFCEAI